MATHSVQGAFRRVNTEVQACAREASALLKRRLAGGEGDAVQSISLLRKLGEPIERLQVLSTLVLEFNFSNQIIF